MKFSVKGDPHNKIKEYYDELQNKDYTFSLCVGDMGIYPDLSLINKVDRKTQEKATQFGETLVAFNPDLVPPVPVYTIPGNHEDQEYLDDLYVDNIIRFNNNLTVLNGAILRIQPNIVLVALGKIFIENTYQNFFRDTIYGYGLRGTKVKNLKYIKRRNHLFKEDISNFVNKIQDFNDNERNWATDKVIWLSHDAPTHKNQKRALVSGASMLGQLVKMVDPDFAFYGHYHYAYEFSPTEMIIQKNELKEFNI